MRDIQTFCKLFKIHAPHHPAMDYYLDTLERTPAYAGARALATRYEAWEDRLHTQDSTAAKARKAATDGTIAALKATAAHARYLEVEIAPRRPRLDTRAQRRGELMVSVDMVKANFNMLRTFDDENALGDTWAAYCESLGLDPLLAESKSLRQIVFGNLAPKRNQRLQLAVISRLIDRLEEAGVEPDKDIALVSPDELVIACGPPEAEADNLTRFLAVLDAQTFERPSRIVLFRHLALDRDRSKEIVYDRLPDGGIRERFARLFGVPAHQFYVYLKRHILDEAVEERDRYFWSDKRLAMWVDVETWQ